MTKCTGNPVRPEWLTAELHALGRGPEYTQHGRIIRRVEA